MEYVEHTQPQVRWGYRDAMTFLEKPGRCVTLDPEQVAELCL